MFSLHSFFKCILLTTIYSLRRLSTTLITIITYEELRKNKAGDGYEVSYDDDVRPKRLGFWCVFFLNSSCFLYTTYSLLILYKGSVYDKGPNDASGVVWAFVMYFYHITTNNDDVTTMATTESPLWHPPPPRHQKQPPLVRRR